MVKALIEDKRRLEINIQKLASYVPQKCRSSDEDLEEMRLPCARIRLGGSENNPNQHDS